MKSYPAGTDIVAFRGLMMSGAFSSSVVPAIATTKAGGFAGIAQNSVTFPPGGVVQVACDEGDMGQAETGGPVAFGDQLAIDDEGRVVAAAVLSQTRLRVPIVATARGSAPNGGRMIAVVIAPRGMTT